MIKIQRDSKKLEEPNVMKPKSIKNVISRKKCLDLFLYLFPGNFTQ